MTVVYNSNTLKITITNDVEFDLSFTSNNIVSELYEIIGFDNDTTHIDSLSYIGEKAVNL